MTPGLSMDIRSHVDRTVVNSMVQRGREREGQVGTLGLSQDIWYHV